MADHTESDSSTGGLRRRFGYVGGSLLLVAIGVGAFVYFHQTRRGPTGQKQRDAGRVVRVFEAQRGPHRVAVTAFGTSRASQQWTAIPEVSGKAVTVNDRFEPGETLPAGALLVEIDPLDYQLAVERAEAEMLARQGELKRLDRSEKDLREILSLHKRQLALAEDEYRRQAALLEKEAVAKTALAKVEDAMVGRLTAVQQTTDRLELIPVDRELAQAALTVAQTQWRQAKRQLAKCRIVLPFAARCMSKQIEPDQFAAVGKPLGTFLALDMAEVVAMVEARKMRALFPKGVEGFEQPVDLAEASRQGSIFKRVRIPAEIRWGSSEQGWVWQGRFARLTGSLDPATRTVAAVFEVQKPYGAIQPGARPPLLPGAFCEVTAYGATLDDVAVVPRDCVHDGRVYLLRGGKLDAATGMIVDGALEIVPVDVLVLEEDRAVVDSGIESGDRVILGDPMADRMTLGAPAVPGMALRGLLVTNPVSPRTKVEVPAGLFEDRPRDAKSPNGAKTQAPRGAAP